MKIKDKKIITGLFLILWMAVIFSFSEQNGETSGGISHSVAYGIAEWTNTLFQQGKTEEMLMQQAEDMQFVIRKGAHMAEYAILAILFQVHICCYKKRPKKTLFWTWLGCTIFAATDEIHQLFIPGRMGQLQDVCIDSAGSLIGALLICFYIKKSKGKVCENHR